MALLKIAVLWTSLLGGLSGLSAMLTIWQWLASRRFPLHQPVESSHPMPSLSILKPLKGVDSTTEACLRSWLEQDYPASAEILFGIASTEDPAWQLAHKLISQYPGRSVRVHLCAPRLGQNGKVSTLVHLLEHATGEVIVASDADVWVPENFLAQLIVPLIRPGVGLVHAFYQLEEANTLASRLEGIAINSDFWSQVLQASAIKPVDFGLGAAMAMPRKILRQIGGFQPLLDYLADDYQLGNRIARAGHQVLFCGLPVRCQGAPAHWRDVWQHQLRWARTIRVCQPGPYFLSVLSNASFWPVLWCIAAPNLAVLSTAFLFLVFRISTAVSQYRQLTRRSLPWRWRWLVPVKDIFQLVLWAAAFLGNEISWRGNGYRVLPDGKLRPIAKTQ